jgi:hypothetical protein
MSTPAGCSGQPKRGHPTLDSGGARMRLASKSTADAFKAEGVNEILPHLQHQAEPLCNRR